VTVRETAGLSAEGQSADAMPDCRCSSVAQQRSSSARTAAFSVACLLAGRAASTHRLQCDPTPANPPMSFADAFVAERHS
jgi:hypothetical protein